MGVQSAILLSSYDFDNMSRLLIHPCGVEGAHDFFGNSANTDSIRQATGIPKPNP